MQRSHSLTSFSDDELLRRLSELLAQSRRHEADLVAHIGEVDRRRLYAREASPSMFAYCTDVLRLSEAEAYLRIAAARASREHPQLLSLLADGRLHLTAVAKLAPHLTLENRDALLERAAHRSKRQIEELVAEISPRADAPAVMRKLPVRRDLSPARRPGSAAEASPFGPRSQRGSDDIQRRPDGAASRESEALADAITARGLELRPDGVEAHAMELRPDGVAAASGERRASVSAAHASPATQASSRRPRPGVVEPLAPARYKVQFTASAELHDKIERLRALLRPTVPDGDLAAIIEQAVTEKLQRLEARRFARTEAARKSTPKSNVSPTTRRIPAAVRRAVYERDGGRCRYEDTQGRRCTAVQGLEFHHRHPYAHGGDHSLANVALMCRSHNAYLAEADYGREAIARHRRSRSRALEAIPPP
jgi:hypothetical protein